MTTWLRFIAALDVCMRLFLAHRAIGVITVNLGLSKATAAGEGSSGMGNIVLLHGNVASTTGQSTNAMRDAMITVNANGRRRRPTDRTPRAAIAAGA